MDQPSTSANKQVIFAVKDNNDKDINCTSTTGSLLSNDFESGEENIGNSDIDEKCTSKTSFICFEQNCEQSFRFAKALRQHLTICHGILFSKQVLKFQTVEEFKDWKNSYEALEDINFVKKNGEKECIDNEHKQYFYCHRSGFHTVKSENIRMNAKSKKIGFSCTCTMTVTLKNDGILSVELFPQHYGHQQNIGLLYLTKNEKQMIASKLEQKVSIDEILKGIQDKLLTSLKPSRFHLVNRQDIYNIQSAMKLCDFKRHENDATSVALLLNELSNDEMSNPVLGYKFQGTEATGKFKDLNTDDVFFALQHPIQLAMLKTFGKRIVCVDSTHGTNKYKFNLITLLVVDEYDEGFPVAFCICNREDKSVLKIFFSLIKGKILENFTPKIFMSDDAPAFYNAWVDIFGAGPKKLLCAWHVEKAIRVKIQALIKDKELACQVYKSVIVLLREKDERKFQIIFKHLSCMFDSDDNVSLFGKYFLSTYSHRLTEIAACYRLNAGINTNMHIEAFHRDFKYNFLKAKVNHRLDSCLYQIFEYVKTKAIARLTKLERGKISNKIKCISNRHKNSLDMNFNSVKEIEDKSLYSVKSSKSEHNYIVSINDFTCECHIKCILCNVCIHAVNCSCLDFLIRNVICKHIHLVVRKIGSKSDLLHSNNNTVEMPSSNENILPFSNKNANELNTAGIFNSLKSHNPETDISETELMLEKIKQQICNLNSHRKREVIGEVNSMLKNISEFLTLQSESCHLSTDHEKKGNLSRGHFCTKKK
ncbi:uncharacterized protein LOC118196736 [Stegodyphus dumicola]|uniref:uncharacterized protein LOC118196736 n=1 Tax=Stegodyphus dumicola TaxID=202533 RepID=UPI0015ACFD42|nr:uncharacterized protein LOC118196736 [Stegodyphus dumicola]